MYSKVFTTNVSLLHCCSSLAFTTTVFIPLRALGFTSFIPLCFYSTYSFFYLTACLVLARLGGVLSYHCKCAQLVLRFYVALISHFYPFAFIPLIELRSALVKEYSSMASLIVPPCFYFPILPIKNLLSLL